MRLSLKPEHLIALNAMQGKAIGRIIHAFAALGHVVCSHRPPRDRRERLRTRHTLRARPSLRFGFRFRRK
jgi:hypothetical protein